MWNFDGQGNQEGLSNTMSHFFPATLITNSTDLGGFAQDSHLLFRGLVLQGAFPNEMVSNCQKLVVSTKKGIEPFV